MGDNKSYRIRTEVGKDSVLNVNLNQSYNTLEVLSLKIGTDNMYKFHTSKYGCVAGRVLANGNFGIPNAKISIFIAATDEELSDEILSYLYPYRDVRDTNIDKIRYNLLPEEQLSDCHRNVGTFPSKRMVLDDDNVLEIYDKFYKFTTRSNEAGDYMIFGVPVGNQTLHVDIDLSDIGILSQRPRDMVYKGYNITQFENANMFKKSNELDNLTQIISENSNVYVYPFWGEKSEGDVAITRKDIEIQYTFEPTCIFMGSIVTDSKSNAISKRCIPSEEMGKMNTLTTGEGTIEMIRKKPDGTTEEMVIQGNQLINGEGVWCYQIPMNLDYVRTDEYGNIVPTDDPTKGIPTRTRVRFRISLNEPENVGYTHLTKVLVPNNPNKYEELDYTFGSATLDNEEASLSFRDLFWNDVYTVKSFIPRIQQFNFNRNKRFSGIKAVNIGENNNPIPYNNMRVDISFMFVLQCAIFKALLKIVQFYNVFARKFAGTADDIKYDFLGGTLRIEFLKTLHNFFKTSMNCITISGALCPDLNGWYFAPGCLPGREYAYENTWSLLKSKESDAVDSASIESTNGDDDERTCLTSNINYFVQCVEINLAMEHNVIQFDFYNDWINGMVYSPRWYAQLKKKRTYFFGLIPLREKINACMEDNFKNSRRYVEQCSLGYAPDSSKGGAYTKKTTKKGCVNGSDRQRCHKSPGRNWVNILRNSKGGGGLVHGENVSNNKVAYYLRPCEWLNRNNNYGTKCNLFATDIVLLGNLEPNNEQGIPQSFTKLPSSTYQIPDTLASTNMGIEGYLYTFDGTSRCNKSLKEDGIEKVDSNFTNLKKWASDQGTSGNDNGRDLNDEDEYAVTEAAGIDWGYSGPNQGENDINSMYFPGGHFLGISCINSEVNVKSCINLRRICEVGSTISQRQAIIDSTTNNSYGVGYLMPTGFISKDEIIDNGFKNEFATMNHNGLKTRYSKENRLKEYDFISVNPVNFGGDFSEVNEGNGSEKYQRLNGFRDSNDANVRDNTKAYTRTIEETSVDYYRYRMGITGDDIQNESKNKFLLFNNNSAYLPVYNNSFYFYFGLTNGATAIDKFKKEFYAECPSMKSYEPIIKVEGFDSELCEDNGKIVITIKNVDNPQVYFENTLIEERVVTGLSHDHSYKVLVYGDNIETIEKEVYINTVTPQALRDIELNIVNFTQEVYYRINSFASQCNVAYDGYFNLFFINENDFEYIRLENSEGYHYLKGDGTILGKTKIIYGDIPGTTEQCYVWEGNSTYTLYFGINCNGTIKEYALDAFNVPMPSSLNIIFNNDKECNHRYLSALVGRSLNNINIVNLINDYTNLNKSLRNSLKQALYYKSTCCQFSPNGKITIAPAYGEPPYTITIVNPYLETIETTEIVHYSGDTVEYTEQIPLITFPPRGNVQNLDMLSDFYAPTMNGTYQNVGSGSSIYDVYYTNKSFAKAFPLVTDWQHIVNITDMTNETLTVRVPSIYSPFYFSVVIYSEWKNVNGEVVETNPSLSAAIVNGIRDDETYILKSVRFNGNDFTNIQTQYHLHFDVYEFDYNALSYFEYRSYIRSSRMERAFSTLVIEPIDVDKSNSYEFTVEDVFDKIESKVTATFIGDKDDENNILPYSSEVRYFLLPLNSTFNNKRAFYLDNVFHPKNHTSYANEDVYRMGYYVQGGMWAPGYIQNGIELIGKSLFNTGATYYTSSFTILAVYDKNINGDITRHTNNIAVLKTYRGDIFKTFIQGIIDAYGNPYE